MHFVLLFQIRPEHLRFTFAVAGWPGSAHDTRILQRSIEKYPVEFPTPPGGNILYL
jgi:hypothetical protein